MAVVQMPLKSGLDGIKIPASDNTSEELAQLRAANEALRKREWPEPFSETKHTLHLGDARDLSWIEDQSVHLVVTSPPYWTLKNYADGDGQMGHIADYKEFLEQLDKVWRECSRVLVPGGRICCVVGDVCVPRKKATLLALGGTQSIRCLPPLR